MDLFGRKAQAELSVAKAMFVEQGQLLEGAVALLRERDNTIATKHDAIEWLRDEVRRLQGTISDLTKPKQTVTSYPLYMNEDEEDLKWQLDNNLIDTATYQQMLKELAFENAEVSLAVEDLPESFHY